MSDTDTASYYASRALLIQMKQDSQETATQLEEIATEHQVVKCQMLFMKAVAEASENTEKGMIIDLYTTWITYIDKLRTLLTTHHVQEKLLYQIASEHTPEDY